MKTKIFLDVWNMTPRAFLQLSGPDVPLNELARIVHYESGGRQPQRGLDIYSILSKREQERLQRLAYPINISGWRGTVLVTVQEKRLEEVIVQHIGKLAAGA